MSTDAPGHGTDNLTQRRALPVTLLRLAAWVLAALVLAVGAGGIALTRIPGACSGCHEPSVVEAYRVSSHSETTCVSCHTTHNAFGGAAGVAHAVGGLVLPSRAGWSIAGAARTDACLECHSEDLLQETVVSRGIRMSHLGLRDGGYTCTECHEGLVHGVNEGKLAVPTMGMCTVCHDGVSASHECDTCHPERTSDDGERLKDAEWAITHGPSWVTAHGLGDLATCSVCHEPEKCVKCHGTPLPHPGDFGITHGAEVIASGRVSCLACHTNAFCTSCHGVEMPHPDGFLPNHSSVAESWTDERCMVCHTPANCNECHERHTHPGARHRMRPPIGMYEANPQ